MSKHRATTGRHRGGRHGGRRRITGGFAGVAVLATGTLVAVPVLGLTGERDAQVAAEDEVAASPPAASISPSLPPTTWAPDGEVDVERDADRRRKPVRESPSVPERGSGAFAVASAPAAETAAATTYRVEVETDLPFTPAGVARFVEATLADERGWSTRHRLERVDGHADLRIVLASPETADSLCAPLDTAGRLSCRNGSDVVLNAWRWAFGADSYAGDLEAYRRYVVNHETGHALGYPHVGCPGTGDLAPVMLQQTKGLEGCKPNPWPARADLLDY